MLSSNSFAVFVSVLALILSFASAIYSYGISKNSFLHTLQKLMLEKAKDCNQIYHTKLEIYTSSIVLHPETKMDYFPVIKEIATSIELLKNSCREYSQNEKKEFFLKQFWIQLDDSLRKYIIEKSQSNVVDDEVLNIFNVYYDLKTSMITF